MDTVTVKFQMTSKEYNAVAYLSETGGIKAEMVDMLQHYQNTKTINKSVGELSITSTLDLPLETVADLQQHAKKLNASLDELIRQVLVDQTEERIEMKRQLEQEKARRIYLGKGHQVRRMLINGETLERYENIFGRVNPTTQGLKEFEANVLSVFIKGLEAIEK